MACLQQRRHELEKLCVACWSRTREVPRRCSHPRGGNHLALIREIRPTGAAEPEGELVDGTELLVTEDLINGHTHSHENFSKGRYENMPLELWMNYVRPPAQRRAQCHWPAVPVMSTVRS